MEKIIYTRKGDRIFVDSDRYGFLNSFTWRIDWRKNTGYAHTTIILPCGKKTTLQMHNAILGVGLTRKTVIDHINGNGLDNRLENLQVVSQSSNIRKGKHKHYHWCKTRNKYIVKINRKYIGQYVTKQQALDAIGLAQYGLRERN